jgi:hypothetical protein
MDTTVIFQLLAVLALAFSIFAFGSRLRAFRALPVPKDRSPMRGDPQAGIFYAFTLGMAPWAKESTRLHAVAYLRGVAFHLGIFLGLGVLLASPWLAAFPAWLQTALAVGAGIGALLGLAGFAARFAEHNLRSLSTPDDYTAVLVVSLFLAVTAAWLAGWVGAGVYYLTAGIMLVYAPFSKIRHCIYFAFSRLFYGRFIGRRAVLPHSQQSHKG